MQHNDNKPSKSGQYLNTDTWEALKAAGFTEAELQEDQPFGPIIFSYTRAQAIEDGVLMDVTPIARAAGFKLHTVITCGLLSELKSGKPEDYNVFTAIYDVLATLYRAVRAQKERDDRVFFKSGELDLWAMVGPGDDAEPVMTVMLVGED